MSRMCQTTRLQLNRLNQHFYAGESGRSFDATRDHPWPGWERVWQAARGGACRQALDLGCGNGRFARFLAGRLESGVDWRYLGLDASDTLLDSARHIDTGRLSCQWSSIDLVARDPGETLPLGPHGLILVSALLHHIPGRWERERLMVELARRLAPGGVLAVTCWRFQREARLRGRIRAWSELRSSGPGFAAAIDPEELEAGDHLLGWQGERAAFRYCHAFEEEELDALQQVTGLERMARFDSDGREGRLNTYLLLRSPCSTEGEKRR